MRPPTSANYNCVISLLCECAERHPGAASCSSGRAASLYELTLISLEQGSQCSVSTNNYARAKYPPDAKSRALNEVTPRTNKAKGLECKQARVSMAALPFCANQKLQSLSGHRCSSCDVILYNRGSLV